MSGTPLVASTNGISADVSKTNAKPCALACFATMGLISPRIFARVSCEFVPECLEATNRSKSTTPNTVEYDPDGIRAAPDGGLREVKYLCPFPPVSSPDAVEASAAAEESARGRFV